MSIWKFSRECCGAGVFIISHAILASASAAQGADSVRRTADTAQKMAAVTTTASAVSARLLAVGFDERRRTSGLPPAHFVTRQQIDRANAANLREMLNALGTRARGCGSGTIFIDGVLTASGTNEVEGAPRRTRSAAATNSLNRSEQLDRISPRDVEGMEIYVGATQIPTVFRTSGVFGTPPSCVIVIWMRSS